MLERYVGSHSCDVDQAASLHSPGDQRCRRKPAAVDTAQRNPIVISGTEPPRGLWHLLLFLLVLLQGTCPSIVCPLVPVSFSPSPSCTLPSLLPPHAACYSFRNVLPSMLFPSAPFIEVSVYSCDFPTLHTDRPTYLDKRQPPEELAKHLLEAEWNHKVQRLVYTGVQLSFKLVQAYSTNGCLTSQWITSARSKSTNPSLPQIVLCPTAIQERQRQIKL